VTPPRDPRLLVVALGSRALRHAADTPDDWVDALESRLAPVAELIAAGFRLIVTHGARTELAEALHRVDLARRVVPPPPLDRTLAATQAVLGYVIQQALANLCRARGLATPVVALVTRAVVEATDDTAGPLVAVGPPYSLARARQLARASGGVIVEEDGLGRRAVRVRRPAGFLETPVIAALVAANIVPIAAGVGGIPVVADGQGHRGAEGVVDPDLASAVLATELRADRLLFLTGVEQAMVGFATPRAIGIADLTLGDARALLDAGELAAGTIGAKVAAGLDFVAAGGREAIITAPASLRAAIGGHAGTRITA
jgi:carbamate kinase